MTNRRCECCSAPLRDSESIVCNPCHALRLHGLLTSPRWRLARGPAVVAQVERELRVTCIAMEIDR